MKLAYFPGCKIDFHLKAYDFSFKSVMEKLSVQLVELPFNCCGYPARDNDFETSLFSSVRNFAIAGKHGLDIITPCKCCYGQLQYVSWQWKSVDKHHPGLKQKFNNLLAKENLFWNGNINIRHLLSFLYHDIGINDLKKRIKQTLPEKKVVAQYGCHALRPFTVTGFDNPHAPHIFEDLINITGLRSVEWTKSTECCGNPILKNNKKLSLKILDSKLDAAIDAGADYICTACTHCQMQYNDMSFEKRMEQHTLVSTPFTRILDRVL